jgi:hypothetical protein
MHITNGSAYPSINAWSRTLAHDTFQTRELVLNYLRWLDQSYGTTVTCTLHADRRATIAIHGVEHLILTVHDGRVCVQWLKPETSYWPILYRTMSIPSDVTQIQDGARWQFYIDTKFDGYLLRDLTCHVHH